MTNSNGRLVLLRFCVRMTLSAGLVGAVIAAPAQALEASAPSAAPKGSAQPSGPAASVQPIPRNPQGANTGHETETPSEGLPPGHPAPGGQTPGHSHGRDPSEPPEDTVIADPALPAGTLLVRIVGADGTPRANVPVTLGIVENTIARGENRKRLSETTSDRGEVRWDGQGTATALAYRVSVAKDGATYALPPFRLEAGKGMRGELHIYPVTHRIEDALVVMQSALAIELRDDRIQVEQAIAVYNFGKVTWAPDNLVLDLPKEFLAFATDEQMSDVRADKVEGQGVRLTGSFVPGKHEVRFRWQLAYDGEPEVRFNVALPPNMASARVLATAAQGMALTVDNFPAAQNQTADQGGAFLVTEKQTRRDDAPIRSLAIRLSNIPETGLPRALTRTVFALVFALSGLAIWLTRKNRVTKNSKQTLNEKKQDLLAALEQLEKSRASGDVGPKTYDRNRRMMLLSLARVLRDLEGLTPANPAKV